MTSWTLSTSISRYSCLVACSTATASPWSVSVIRLMWSLSVRETARESMLKLRARIRLATRLSTPGRSMTSTTRMWRWASPVPGNQAVGGRVLADVGGVGGVGRLGWRVAWSGVIPPAPTVSIRSDRPLPAGMMGNTFCSCSISNQMSAGPSTACAARMAGSTSLACSP